MADNKDLTVYQKLFYLFGQNKPTQRATPKYSFSDGDLMRSQEEYNKQKQKHFTKQPISRSTKRKTWSWTPKL